MKLTLSLLIILIAIACGQSGDNEGRKARAKKTEEPPPAEEDDLALRTDVSLNPMLYQEPYLSACLKTGPEATLGEVRGLSVDGNFEEWQGLTASLTDITGEHSPSAELDLGSIWIGRSGQGVGLAVGMENYLSQQIYFDFVGHIIKGGAFDSQMRKSFRISGPSLELKREGEWFPLENESYRIGKGTLGLELWISNDLLDDAVTWPLWSIRVHGKGDGGLEDSTHSQMFLSVLGADHKPFHMHTCTKWARRDTPHKFYYVREAGVDAAVADQAFRITRLAFDTLSTITMDDRLPVTSIVVAVTDAKVDASLEKLSPVHNRDAYNPLVLNINGLAPSSQDPFPESRLFRRSVEHLTRLYLVGRHPEAPRYLLDVAQEVVVSAAVALRMGEHFWLDYLGDSLDSFSKTKMDIQTPVSLSERYDLSQGEKLTAESRHKAFGFSYFLKTIFSAAEVIQAWSAAPQVASKEDFIFQLALLIEEDEGRGQALEMMQSGWLNGDAYYDEYSPIHLKDADGDGLPSFFEMAGAYSDPLSADTDGDGWTDYSELFSKTDPRSETVKPGKIMPDGNFNDWLELMPRRITVDKGAASACPKSANITHYSALVSRDYLMIGAYVTDFWEDEPKARWEAVLDFPEEERSVILSATSNSTSYVLKDGETQKILKRYQKAPVIGRDTVEWAIDRNVLGIESYLNKKSALRLRLRTIYEDEGKDTYCDETAWISPYISD